MFIIRPLQWLIRKIGIPTVLSLLLIYVAQGVTLQGLNSVIRGLDVWWLGLMVAGGVLLGWGVGRTAWPGWLGGLSALLLGSTVTLIRLANLGGIILALSRSGIDVVTTLLTGRFDVAPLRPHLAQLGSDVGVLLTRLSRWLVDWVGGQPAYEPVATAFIWSLTIWGVAVWAAWWVRRRRQPLVALLPAGGLLTTVLAHSRESLMPLVIFLAVLLLLTGLLKQQENERRWQQRQIGFSTEIRTDLALAILPTALALIVIAAAVPTLPFRQITQFSRDLFREQIIAGNEVAARALGLNIEGNANAAPATALDEVRRGGLPRNHLLGAGPELAEQMVMVIQTNDPPPTTPEETPPRYYWRSHTYDRYNGRGWLATQTETTAYAAGESVTGPNDGPHQRILQQEVRLTPERGGLLYTAGALITADQPFEVAWRSHDDIFGTTTEALAYRAESRLPAATAAALRSSGSDYPDWIRRRYLHLPDSIPNRVLTLARDLTATEPTPYDRAKAIERYLRAFPYNLDLPGPPPDRDIADYFLFDLQQGYCDYYATSMVVLARAAGIPARLAVGYINGTYDRANHRYLVSEAEAHAWVEIYFPDTGWVTFEPTGGRPALERAESDLPPVPPELETPPEAFSTARGTPPNRLLWWWLALPGTLLLVVAVVTAGYTLDGWRLRRLAPVTTIALIQQRLHWHAHRLHTPTHEGDTPYELMAEMTERINDMATRKKWGGYLNRGVADLRSLTELYVRASYSPHRLDATDRARAVRLWQRLRWRLWLARLLELRIIGLHIWL